MKKTLQTLRFLAKNTTGMVVIGFFSVIGIILLTDLIFYLTDRYNADHHVLALTAPIDITSALFAWVTGTLLFIANFKVALANGVSRKTFLLADLLAAMIAAAAFSIFNCLIVFGLSAARFWPIIMTMHLLYPNIGWIGLFLYQFALYFMLILFGWFIVLAYYRSNVSMKWVISLAPFVLFGLLLVANARYDGAVFGAIWTYLNLSMGRGIGRPDPYRAVVTMLSYAAALCGLVYLLIRKAPIKD